MSNPTGKTKQDYETRMNRVLEHIQGHLDEPLALDELAAVACFSPYHFHRIFSGMIGESVKSYIRRLRLERAAFALMHTAAPVTEIAFDAGFETHESFTRAFSSMFGVSPLGFRKAHQVSLQEKHITYWKEITMEAKVVELKETEVYFVRHVGPYMECETAWNALCGWAGPKGLFTPGMRALALCHDDPEVTPANKIRYDACIESSVNVEPESPVGKKTIPGGRHAMAIHKGPYIQLCETYAQLCGQWLPQQGHEIAAKASIEVYVNDPNETAPEDLITEIYIPLK